MFKQRERVGIQTN